MAVNMKSKIFWFVNTVKFGQNLTLRIFLRNVILSPKYEFFVTLILILSLNGHYLILT
jgi:hypothetical protein